MMNRRQLLELLSLVLGCLCGVSSLAQNAPKEQLDFFESRIRPVLVRECYSCHSEEASGRGKLRGQLFLDTRDGMRKGGETGPVLNPGKPEESLLISALKHESIEMPPKGKLPLEVIADFEKWILQGAVDPRIDSANRKQTVIDIQGGKNFWSFLPLKQIEAPKPLNSQNWAQTPIDRFIHAAQLQQACLPNPVADVRTLIRRAWLDLLGLPPTPEEMNAWTARLASKKESKTIAESTSEKLPSEIDRQQWSILIDHLLESPHFGERQARHWMDVARFAESHGYEQDYDRPNAFHYRDFLIRAFNSDLPYDQFVQWQIAGDQIAPDNPLAWMATGFLGAGAFPTQLTETEFESARYDELDDMVATTGVAFLGLSVGCARCHDHKFDPIPTADYYKLAACFTKAIRAEKQFDLEPEENAKRRELFTVKLAAATQALREYEAHGLPVAFAQWLIVDDPDSQGLATWQLLTGELHSQSGVHYRELDDHSYLTSSDPPATDVLTFTAKVKRSVIQAVRIEALTHESLPARGPGRAANGNFVLGNLRLHSRVTDSKSNDVHAFKDARATHQQNTSSLAVKASLDNDPASGWAVDGQIGKDQAAVFYLEKPLTVEQDTILELQLAFNHPNPRHIIGRMRFSITAAPVIDPAVGEAGPPQSVQIALEDLRAGCRAGNTKAMDLAVERPAQWTEGINYYRSKDVRWNELSKAVEHVKASGSGEQLATVMVTTEGLPHLKHHADDRGFPHYYPVTYQLRRGDATQKVQEAVPGVLQVLSLENVVSESSPPIESTPSRTSLARWITNVRSGAGNLAARVMVNRIWQHHFGTGLVATPNDFGASGQRPTHPELLDFMAKQFIDDGWKIKPLHRAIMNSSVYMQASYKTPNDSRDAIDVDNNLLWRQVPRRLEAEAIRDSLLAISGQLDKTMYGPGTLDGSMRRRSVYFFIKRSQLIPSMMLFDWPEHLVSIGQRPSTTIAPQALMFMNSPDGRSFATSLSNRLDLNDHAKAIEQAYQLALARKPKETELQLALDFLKSQAALRTTVGEDDAEKMAMADLCQAILSMNELIYID
jgi:Protein of unknown function (DUF1553)/Protein of unknown function (DUF1549)/Planctomycete cytochrome C